MVRLTGILLAMLLLPARAQAQPVPTADPKYHGTMVIHRAEGTIANTSLVHPNYNALLKIGRVPSQGSSTGLGGALNWGFEPAAQGNGLYPDQEPIIVAIGDDTFTLDAGALHANRKGNAFVYRAAGKVLRGVRLLRLMHDAAGKWKMSVEVAGVDLSRLQYEDPICRPMAVIVGDDDGFGFVVFTRRSFRSRKVSILVAPPDADCGNGWPWLNR